MIVSQPAFRARCILTKHLIIKCSSQIVETEQNIHKFMRL